jgi:hypothetical protein
LLGAYRDQRVTPGCVVTFILAQCRSELSAAVLESNKPNLDNLMESVKMKSKKRIAEKRETTKGREG